MPEFDDQQPDAPATATGAAAPAEATQSAAPAAPTGPTAPRRARGVLLVSARVVAGLIGVAATAATVLAATILPLPEHVATPPWTSVTPVPAPQQRACAGPVLRLGDDTGASATVASAVGTPQVRHLATGGTVDESRIGQTEEPSGRSAAVITLSPDGADSELQPLLTGSQLQNVSSGDVAGLAAAECVEARAETWLVGGSTDTGRTTLLTLTNPGAVAATVGITVYSQEGAVDAPGAEGIVVQPGSEVNYSLAGFAPGLASPVVRVVSVGGSVVANLQQTTVRILEPGGVDIVGPSAAPATDIVIPGMVVRGHELVEEQAGAPGFEDITPVLRLFVPGEKPASASITVTPDDGGDPVGVNFDLPAGQVSEFPFEHYEDGNYTVSVNSDVPLVAGARTSTVGESGGSDFAWLESAEVMRKHALVCVGSGADATLHLVNPADTDALVTVEADGGAADTVTVPAGGTVTLPAEPSTSYRLGGFEVLRVAVSYVGDGLLSGFTVSPTGPAAKPITVYP